MTFRCEWCGRFYSSLLPEGSACPNHILEHNERLRRDIDRFNAKLTSPLSDVQGRTGRTIITSGWGVTDSDEDL